MHQTHHCCRPTTLRPCRKDKTKAQPVVSVTSHRTLLYELQCGRCFYCLRETAEDKFTVDHIVPKSKGGSGSIVNKVGACFDCNQWKRDQTVDDDWVSERIETFNHRDWDRAYRR